MARKTGQLNPRQQRFVQAYLIAPNGAQSAITAGYSPKTAKQQASRLLTDVNVCNAISEAESRMARKNGVDHEYLIKGYKRIADEGSDVKASDQLHAMDSLGKHLGFFKADNEQAAPVIQVAQAVDLEDRIKSLEKKGGSA